MGMTIDEALEYLTDFSVYSPYQEAVAKISAYIKQMQSDYENRLKADMVAMLDELDLRLYEQYDDTDLIKVKYVRQAIQQKINALNVESEDSTPREAVDAIPRERIEQIKAELTKDYVNDNPKNFTYTTVKLKEVLYIIDKYTKEQNND